MDKILLFVKKYPVMLNSDDNIFLHGSHPAEAKLTTKKPHLLGMQIRQVHYKSQAHYTGLV
jgi:hypothetical protein